MAGGRGWEAGGGVGAAAAQAAAAQACTGDSRLWVLGHARLAHEEHLAHVRDLGRVEGQRLVERRRLLPSQKEGMRCGARCGMGGHTKRC